MKVDGSGVLVEFFDVVANFFELVLLLLELVGDLDEQGLVALDIICHGFEGSVDPLDCELLLDEDSLLLAQLIEHASLYFLYFIHYSVSHRVATLFNDRNPVHIHLQLHVQQHFLVLGLDHRESIIVLDLGDPDFLVQLFDHVIASLSFDKCFGHLETQCSGLFIQSHYFFEVVKLVLHFTI